VVGRFRRNGVLSMLERDIKTKKCPQRWQDLSVRELQDIDVVLCFDDRIFEIVLEDLQLRVGTGGDWRPLHLLCLDTKDTPEHAKIGGGLALELCQAVRPLLVWKSGVREGRRTESLYDNQIDQLPDLYNGIADAIDAFEASHKLRLLYSLIHI
jgi:hypothetical protein